MDRTQNLVYIGWVQSDPTGRPESTTALKYEKENE